MRPTLLRRIAFTGGVSFLAGSLLAPEDAAACGGFFCSQAAPVNQAAERILFAENGDGTVTAVIQILYEGPSENFSWLLPISTVPRGNEDIAVASNIAFTRLQNRTNPTYILNTRVEGECKDDGLDSGDDGAFQGEPPRGEENPNGGSGVTVEASGIVGAFEWTVISLDPALEDPADVAVDWLERNDYDVADGARGLLRPYLEDGLYLLALRLTKGSDTGSIRPIALTYAADKPMIPIKLTAVAANENMGVMTWLLSSHRGVPQNYLSLELNEAKINWFNAASNYDAVVTAAADEASGQGFVTEFAAPSSALANSVWSQREETQWNQLRSRTNASSAELFNASLTYAGWDGFWDTVRANGELPRGVTDAELQECPSCYASQVRITAPADYLVALEKDVIEPVRLVQRLIDSHAYTTRLYTTMSAAEMTVDPLFTFNADLGDVSNVHTAEHVVECNPDIEQLQAPWRLALPQGGTIRGVGRTWPGAAAVQPSNLRIRQLSGNGTGAVLEDNASTIDAMLVKHNGSIPSGRERSDGGCALAARSASSSSSLVLAALALLAWTRRTNSQRKCPRVRARARH